MRFLLQIHTWSAQVSGQEQVYQILAKSSKSRKCKFFLHKILMICKHATDETPHTGQQINQCFFAQSWFWQDSIMEIHAEMNPEQFLDVSDRKNLSFDKSYSSEECIAGWAGTSKSCTFQTLKTSRNRQSQMISIAQNDRIHVSWGVHQV